MGDRISIQFKKGKEVSPVLFSHWDGLELLKKAKEYIKVLKAEAQNEGDNLPLHRLEPETVMVDFIRDLTKDLARVKGNYYLGATERDGDNDNRGHHIIRLSED